MVKNKVSKLMVDTLYPDRNQMPQPCLDVLSMSRFSTDAVSDTYTCRDLDNMTTAAFTKQHTFCSSITSANFEGGGVKTCAGNADTGGGSKIWEN